jgi:UPF0176 protein
MITNVAAYHFAPLTDLKPWREAFLARGKETGLKGTILLSPEGVNLFVAGEAAAVEGLLAEIRACPGLEGLQAKVSLSEHQPFTRWLVRIKKEIIAFGVEGIEPGRRTSPKLTPRELKQWLDEGRPVTLLDTRNDYEVKLGTFRGATTLGLDHFRNFPAAVAELPEALKAQPIVMFCTGGIRCEKAGPFMEREGFGQIYQLEGGILKYFEDCGNAHYDGECFVFDQRVGVDAGLAETESAQCWQCQSPLSAEDQASPYYQPPRQCPYCYVPPEEHQAAQCRRREAQLRALTTPLPGSVPTENHRPIKIPARAEGGTILDFLTQTFPHITPDVWQARAAADRLCGAHGPVPLTHPVKAGERYYHVEPCGVEPDVATDLHVLHEDEALIVLAKPAPLPMHPCGRFHLNTLQHFLQLAYAPQKPRPAHRLDAGTTGVVVFCRTRFFASQVQPQFEKGEIKKVYLARVQGHPSEDELRCEAPIADRPDLAGRRRIDPAGLASQTDFRVLERRADGTALVEARPHTGRTHQIRLHLAHLGWPIVGDPVYGPDGPEHVLMTGGSTPTPEDAPLCLHAHQLTFRHPLTRVEMTFTAPHPGWM